MKRQNKKIKEMKQKLAIIAALALIAVFMFTVAVFTVNVFAEEVEYTHTHKPEYLQLTEIYQPLPDYSEVVGALDRILGQLMYMQTREESNAHQAAQQMEAIRNAIGSTGSIESQPQQVSALAIQSAATDGTPLGKMEIGARVIIREDGVPVNYIVVQHGHPNNDYMGFENGTVLLRERLWGEERQGTHDYMRQMHKDGVSDYKNADLRHWLNSSFLYSIDEPMRNQILEIRIPYRPGETSSVINIGINGLQTRVFTLSHTEVGFDNYYHLWGVEHSTIGGKFTYFYLPNNSLRWNRTDDDRWVMGWWLRTPFMDVWPGLFWCVSAFDGEDFAINADNWQASRPAFALPSNLIVNSDGEVTDIFKPEPGNGGNDPGFDGEGMLGLLTILIGRIEELTNELRYMETVVTGNMGDGQMIGVWHIAVGSFQVAVSLVILFAFGWGR